MEKEKVLIYDGDNEVEMSKECFDKITKANQKNYLGDVKWVLYQYICDMNTPLIHIRCGNYAWEKLKKIIELHLNRDTRSEHLRGQINGEEVVIYNIKNLDKKQLIISVDQTIYENMNFEYKTTVFPDDIVLYFA